ncbi:unnamed protein product [Albugo candida]|uniref:CRAL-TRIO domain-containing protein n=1 Tax=Albugo candida TaxID=65357 RepID=A0A024GT49_9STRA|nr:unnamed protein product [Albugo candida]|eukprot:CCI49934.1 unnamed protein product [Albugo candida]
MALLISESQDTYDQSAILRYGCTIRLYATSSYLSGSNIAAKVSTADSKGSLLGIGYYEKKGRHGILSCVPPLGDELDHLFVEDEFTVLDPLNVREIGDVVEYGHMVVLVNRRGWVWNNKTGGITGYIGPRPRQSSGEMYVAFYKEGKIVKNNVNASLRVNRCSYAKDSRRNSLSSLSEATGLATSTATSSETQPASNQSTQVKQSPVFYGDHQVSIAVLESRRHTALYNKKLSNYKKNTSQIAGGYICSDGKGTELKFTILPPHRPKIEQIRMQKRIISQYEYSQKIVLPSYEQFLKRAVALGVDIDSNENRIVLCLANQWEAIISRDRLQEYLLTHIESNQANQVNSRINWDQATIIHHSLSKGPGQLVLKIVGEPSPQLLSLVEKDSPQNKLRSPRRQTQLDPSTSKSSLFNEDDIIKGNHKFKEGIGRSVFYMSVKVIRLIPIQVFVPLYCILSYVLLGSLSTMGESSRLDTFLRREIFVFILVILPAFYAAVHLDHPWSSLFEMPAQVTSRLGHPSLEEEEPQANSTLKLVVVDYRFQPERLISETAREKLALRSTSNTASSDKPRKANKSERPCEDQSLESTNQDESDVLGSATSHPSVEHTGVSALSTPQRYVIAAKGDPARALERYQQTLAWRKEEELDSILLRPWPYLEIIKQNYPHFYHKRGKEGEPVYYEKPGQINLKALKSAGIQLDDLLHNYLLVTEFLWQVVEKDDMKKCISVVDVQGIGFSDFAGETIEYVRKAASITEKHYPERCAYIFIINVPSWFSMIWNVVKGMVDEVTQTKVTIVRGKKQILEALQSRIPLENIPVEYGGLSEDVISTEEQHLFELINSRNMESNDLARKNIGKVIECT